MKQLYIMRHMQTDYNKRDLFQGLSDSPITDEGRAKITQFQQFFKSKKIDTIYSSPLPRCYETAQLLAIEQANILVEERLTEVCYGEWEGLSKIETKTSVLWAKRVKDRFNFMHPGIYYSTRGQSYRDLYERLIPFWEEMKVNVSETSLIVGHMGVMIAAKKYFLHLSDSEINDFSPRNNMIIHISLDPEITYTELTI